jgi:hypothetical protein
MKLATSEKKQINGEQNAASKNLQQKAQRQNTAWREAEVLSFHPLKGKRCSLKSRAPLF